MNDLVELVRLEGPIFGLQIGFPESFPVHYSHTFPAAFELLLVQNWAQAKNGPAAVHTFLSNGPFLDFFSSY